MSGSEENLKAKLIYFMYGRVKESGKSVCQYLENFIAFQTVIQELRIVCDDREKERARG